MKRTLDRLRRAAGASAVLLALAGCGKPGGGTEAAPAARLYQGKALVAWIAQAGEARGEARLQAVRAIGALAAGGDTRAAAPALLEALQDPGCRAAAALALGGLGPEAAVAVPALVRALRDEDQEVRTSAAAALEKIGAPAIPQLVAAVQSWEDRPPFYGEKGTWFDELVRVQPHLVAAGLGVIALVALGVLYQSLKLWTRHRERLARIQNGLEPDAAAPAEGSPREPDGKAA